ncbi:hypothetical protein [Mycobacterium montefiorense]|uniref:Exported repetitive protein n=1 Tax=Mycobacterium montefiorense TaxID=154654 RepID=A0AA37PR58_9MYCO|nr:hypothetical protein [Mycobacterium montefiorense]GBG39502.1 hypothetical protein MmonteBS_38740 [Mycobacterium montefiorense]GKU36087.1 hypothetical protein NJB14191_34330 [Mycobacterium montefiorense]GKU41159.1 hypothetical protein NJB14192_31430 [Mycobacterium montefiorense]GKU44084.1 hypothetical protein NJB14194_07150 [Mycobacterium montefiorense]GKU52502.1 hypothetical protein NJB14195_37450 [Mycobacterium montefiorense]
MPTIWTYAKAAAVVVGSSAALLTGGIAHADPVPAMPDPVQNIPQQLIASAANAPQILQNLATALGAQPPAAPAQPGITFPGLASAAQPAAAAPAGIPSIPGLTPAATAPTAPTAASPTIPGLGSIPGLAQSTPAAPAAPASSGIPGLGSMIPGLSTPTAPAAAAPATSPLSQVANVNMPALPSLPGLPLSVPPKLSLPGDLPALATGAVPGTPAAPAAAAPAPSLFSALP